MSLTVAPGERHIARVFSLSMDPGAARQLAEDAQAQARALGVASVNQTHVAARPGIRQV